MAKRRQYEDTQAGEWVFPKRRGYRVACCGCGLVHRYDYRLNGRHIEFRVFLDNRATGQIRRWMRAKAKT